MITNRRIPASLSAMLESSILVSSSFEFHQFAKYDESRFNILKSNKKLNKPKLFPT